MQDLNRMENSVNSPEEDILVCKDRLHEQLEKAKDSLDKVNSNLKKFVSDNANTARPIPKRAENYEPATGKWKISKDNSFKKDLRSIITGRQITRNEVENVPVKQRLAENQPKVIYSRLSGPPSNVDYCTKRDESPEPRKPTLASYVVAKQVIIPPRKQAASVRMSRETRARDRRMFGALLGTLQKFKQEENQLKEKVEKKERVEKKVEEAARIEKERLREEKMKLIKARKDREAYIQAVEAHIQSVRNQEQWEELVKPLFNYIRTKTEPYVYYRPKVHTTETEKLFEESKKILTEEIEAQRNTIKETTDGILQKWEVENLEQIPEVTVIQPPAKLPSEAETPFPNIDAIPVKPNRSPIPLDDDDEHPVLKQEKQKDTGTWTSPYAESPVQVKDENGVQLTAVSKIELYLKEFSIKPEPVSDNEDAVQKGLENIEPNKVAEETNQIAEVEGSRDNECVEEKNEKTETTEESSSKDQNERKRSKDHKDDNHQRHGHRSTKRQKHGRDSRSRTSSEREDRRNKSSLQKSKVKKQSDKGYKTSGSYKRRRDSSLENSS